MIVKQFNLTQGDSQKVFQEYVDLVKSMDDKYSVPLLKMMEDLGERLFFAPASNNLKYHNCFRGGLVEHSLRVYKNLRKAMNAHMPHEDYQDSIKLVALFHDLGKVGSFDEDYFIPQTNEWRRENLGEYYTHNDKLLFMDTAHRSLRWLSHYGVPMTDEEYQAILIHDGQYIEANKRYAHKECMFALLLHQADMLACKQEHEMWKEYNE